jgi:hypothetical protein
LWLLQKIKHKNKEDNAMDITVKKHQIIKMYDAIEKAGEKEIGFENFQVVHDLALNKKCLAPAFEALRMLDKEAPEYRKFKRDAETIRAKHSGDPEKFKSEMTKYNAENIEAINIENDRREAWIEELETEVTIPNIRMIKVNGIKGTSSAVLKFINDIEPMIDFGE